MYSFRNDYSEGAHPAILEALKNDNMTQEEGYGMDRHTENAVSMIRELAGDPEADVHLLSGGTQTNLIAISAFLRPHEACIAPATGHISTHETGAIEATGHKLLTIETSDGKLTPELIAPVLSEHHFEHMVKPGMVYISNPTELGTVYTKTELEDLGDFCRENHLLLYADGARLGAALVIDEAEISLGDMYRLTDAFFIGGTKLGALLGEALVIRRDALKADFRYLLKQRGGLLAKGRVLGVQFETLFRENLYFDLARHGNEMARRLAEGLKEAGCNFLIDSPTNQIFPVMANPVIEKLSDRFGFYVWAKTDEGHSTIRLVTSWATPPEAVEEFLRAYEEIKECLHA
jgi:threonine aldolase